MAKFKLVPVDFKKIVIKDKMELFTVWGMVMTV